ncbi:peptidase inhibitor family I36 protein [Streptomyces sp. NPDC015032]|uniref:peptidase inhibitor family I36 protein n=1 Tax=Streptomyces sp. NPDC015032 TaxID=3364937 RepID=UPI0036FAD984
MRSTRTVLVTGAVIFAFGGLMAAVPATAADTSPRVAAAAAPSGCASGDVCFYSEKNYKGSKCSWDAADPDTLSGSVVCSWMKSGTKVKSVYNHGTSSDGSTGVVFFRKKDYVDRIGCTKNGSGGNLAGTYIPRSLKWTSGDCG